MATKVKDPSPMTARDWYASHRTTQINYPFTRTNYPRWISSGKGLIAPVDGSKADNIPAGMIYGVEVHKGLPAFAAYWRDTEGDGIAASNTMALDTARVYRSHGKLIRLEWPVSVAEMNARAKAVYGDAIEPLDEETAFRAYGLDYINGAPVPGQYTIDDE